MSASEGSKSNCRDFFSSCSENIDVGSESGSELEEEIFKEESQNALYAFEPVGCLGETNIYLLTKFGKSWLIRVCNFTMNKTTNT